MLVTAGPTYEPIDPVRFIGNFSSGKMGFAIAEAFAAAGAQVILVSGPSSQEIQHSRVKRVDVQTAEQMNAACQEHFPTCQGAILAAAVADYRPVTQAEQKMKKQDQEHLTLTLVKNPDILAGLGQQKQPQQVLAGFSLETHNEEVFALEKLERKNLDFIVLNSLRDEGAGFQYDTNRIRLLYRDGRKKEHPLQSKKAAATDIVQAFAQEWQHKVGQ